MAVEHTYITKKGHETRTLTPAKAIRKKCLECCCWSQDEVKMCTAEDCALWPFRFGKGTSGRKGDKNRFKNQN